MPKKKNISSSSFRFIDGLVSILCLTVAAGCLYLFWIDLFGTLSRLGERPVGTITWKYKAAQRRFSDRVLWDRLQMESPVYNGDLIRTAVLSEASITFYNGGYLDLAENSLIRIFTEDAIPQLDLMEGTLSASSGEGGMIIRSGDHELALDSGGTAQAAGGTGAEFAITGGRGTLRSGGQSRDMGDGEAFGSGALTVVASPRPNARIIAAGSSPGTVNFLWTRQNYTGPTRIDLARDRNFTRPAAALEVPGGENRARVELSPGTYYWRAYSAQTAAPSRYFKLSIINAAPPRPISPEEGQGLPRYSGSRPLRFRWASGGGAPANSRENNDPDYYLLEAADNPGMANPAVQIRTRRTQADTSLLGPGRWFWRVSAYYETVSQVSAPVSFTIDEGGGLEAPVLIAPAPSAEVDIKPGSRNVYFSWRTVNGAASYTLLVSPNPDLSDPVISRRMVKENYYGYPVDSGVLKTGQYYWGVSPVDAGGREFSFSSTRSFSAGEIPPALGAVFPPDNYTVAEALLPDIRFTWKTDLSPVRFQIAGDGNFTSPVVDEAARSSFFQGRRLPPGGWYWRVLAGPAVPGGRPISTPPRRLVVAGPMPSPVLAAGESRIIVSPGERARFRWQPVEGADRYQFRLYNAGGTLFHAEETAANSVNLVLDEYPEGNYRWTVQALTRESAQGSQRNGPAGMALFYLAKAPEREEEPAPRALPAAVQTPPLRSEPEEGGPPLITPAHNRTFGVAQLRAAPSIVFEWEAVEGASGYTFTVSSQDGRQVLHLALPSPSYVLDDLSILSRGSFTWQVRANWETEGKESPPSQRSFIIDIPAVNQTTLQDIGTLYGK
ncbi:MAG: hypothetical protein LBO65_11005 [Spirochaetaceae bacterium]|jgi:hypothetical protein|nr:hypothetical protein [Spirochaetaceae bacterium]